VACQLLSLESKYPPAYQLALDMLKRLHTNAEILEVLLTKKQVTAALRFIRAHTKGVKVSPARFLEMALAADREAINTHSKDEWLEDVDQGTAGAGQQEPSPREKQQQQPSSPTAQQQPQLQQPQHPPSNTMFFIVYKFFDQRKELGGPECQQFVQQFNRIFGSLPAATHPLHLSSSVSHSSLPTL